MAVSREEVRRIAELARLRPDDAAIDRLTEELNGILEHIRTLEEVGAAPEAVGAAIGPETLRARDPELPADPLAPGAPGDRAPAWRDGFFVVPRLPALDGDAPGEEAP